MLSLGPSSSLPARAMDTLARAFLDASRHYLRHDYLPRIEGCLDRLSEEDLWWRPNDASNSVGNLILHLAGNIRQWIVHGVGGGDDVRDRPAEFEARGPMPAAELRALLHDALGAVDAVLAGLTADELHETRRIQGLGVTGMQAVYHVVEHFSMHTGQILYITKLRTGQDLGFYRIKDGTVLGGWTAPA